MRSTKPANITASTGRNEVPAADVRRKTAAARSKGQASTKLVYLFVDGKAEGNAKMRELLGGKGAGLAEMTNAGLPVPPGFTITTQACNAYFDAGRSLPPGLWDQVEEPSRASRRRRGRSSATAKIRCWCPCDRARPCRCPG